MADLNPKPEEVQVNVPHLRTGFKEKFADNIKNGSYDQRDIDRLDKDDAYARAFLRTLKANGDAVKAVDLIDNCFRFRKSIGLCDLTTDDFPSEIKDRNAIYFKGQDKNGHPILYVNVKENLATDDLMPLLKQYIAWVIEQHHGKDPEQMCVVLMDMGSAEPCNLGSDVTKYLIACFTIYFPAFLAYVIYYDIPDVLCGTLSAIGSVLHDDRMNQKLVTAKKTEISKYISLEHLWPHMK